MSNISLYYFVAVAEELNITRAASKLFISQQALSEHIKKLEKQYGAVFFERGTHLKLTYQGERMLAYARKALEAEHDLTEKLRDDGEQDRVRMTIGQTSLRGMVFLPTIFANYHLQCPNVVLSVMSGNHDHISNQLRMGKIELYMGMTDNIRTLEKGETFYRDELYFIISKELLARSLGTSGAEQFVLAHREGVHIKEASLFPLALPPIYSTLRAVFERSFADCNTTPQTILETVNHDILFDVCQLGMCCAFVSRELLYRKLMHKSLPPNVIFLPAAGIGALSCFGIVYNEKDRTDYAARFVACCKETVTKGITQIDRYLVNEVSAMHF